MNESTLPRWALSEQQRAVVYRFLLALVALASVYGLIAEQQIAGWVGVITAVLGNSLAVQNTRLKVDQ